jgi:hypothetical protein
VWAYVGIRVPCPAVVSTAHIGPPCTHTGSGSGHGWVVGVTSLIFSCFRGPEVKMKCPKSEEFWGIIT